MLAYMSFGGLSACSPYKVGQSFFWPCSHAAIFAQKWRRHRSFHYEKAAAAAAEILPF